jgi:hypothetical protein
MIDDHLYKKVDIIVPGWKNPITILYAIVKLYNENYLVWYLKNVESYKFKIPYKIVLSDTGSDYKIQFQKVLIQLRLDIINWYYTDEKEDWMIKYIDLFEPYIVF